MKAVILAGGLGTRLSEETDRIPKPMVEIGGRPILWHIMNIYAAHGITEFVVCLGYRGYVVKEFFANYFLHTSDMTFDLATGTSTVHRASAEGWKVTLVDTGVETLTGGRLLRVRDYVADGTFCMTYGDGLGDVDLGALIAFHRGHGRLATVTAISPPGRWGTLEIEGGNVRRFREKADADGGTINGGFFVLEPAALDAIDGDATAWEREPMQRLAARGELMAWRHHGFWQPMDTLREKRELERVWAEGRAPWKIWR